MEDNLMDLLFVSDDGSMYGFDTTGDGMVDTFSGVYDDNGHLTEIVAYDSDANGIIDTFVMEMDTTGDGILDTLAVGHDYDQDGNWDNVKYYLDKTNNGEYDTVINLHNDNVDPDIAYRFEIDIDTDGDHISDFHYEDVIPADDPHFGHDFAGGFLGSATEDGTFDPNTPNEYVAGEPAKDMEVWECQGSTNRCALYSQKFAIEQLTGQEIDIEEFADIAKENGWFTEENGTNGLNMNKMLEYYGIDHDVMYDTNLSDLEDALRNGDKIIVSVDSGQIWYGDSSDIFSPATGSDHALEVIGIDYSDPDAPMVVLNDSGSPAGCGEMVPMDTFESAWAAGDHQMIVCHA